MKIVREHINERFTETGDPVHQMGIGAKHLLKPFVLNKVLDQMTESTAQRIQKLFGESVDNLYFLGDSSYSQNQKYIRKIRNLIKKGQLIDDKSLQHHETDTDDGYLEKFELYQTAIGRIMIIRAIGATPAFDNDELQFVGDLEAAANLNIFDKEKEIIDWK